MTAFDSFPLGQPGFVSHILDRAAHLRGDEAKLMAEISRVARALKEITKCDKLNIAALGNMVPQLHVHVIARRSSDAAWPRPVWGVMPPLAQDAEEVQNFISALRRKIWLG